MVSMQKDVPTCSPHMDGARKCAIVVEGYNSMSTPKLLHYYPEGTTTSWSSGPSLYFTSSFYYVLLFLPNSI